MTNDGANTMTYDAENRAVSAAGATYTYDGNSLRVKKISGGTTTYHHSDHLSVRLTTDTSGTLLAQQGHYPYGESWYASGSVTKWKFTTYERDTESGNDYSMFRYAVNRLGRFSSPDPFGGSISDPQSLNRYAYARSDPVNLTDPLGLREHPLMDPSVREGLAQAFSGYDRSGGGGGSIPLEVLENLPGFGTMWGSFEQAALARHESIITIGYDPALGRFRGDIEITATRPNGMSTTETLNMPTMGQVGAALNRLAVWAAGAAGMAFGQFPQAAAAGAGGVSVAVTWIGSGGAVIGGGTLLVAGGVVVGVAAVGYGGYLAYRYFKIPKVIRDAAGAVGVSARALGDAVEQFKFNNNLPNDYNLDWATIVAIAEALKRGEYYTK